MSTVLGLAGVSAVGALNALEPRAGLRIARDLAYGRAERQKLDVYSPRPGPNANPMVVFFYGGAWEEGRRQDYAFVGAALASKGFVVAVPDYRLYPEVRWPAFLEDSALAVRWARDHATEYGGDPARIAVMGHSAGAYNAAMLAVDRRWLGAVHLDPRRDLRAMVGLAGPYDFLPLRSETLKAIFGPEPQRRDTQPINHLDGRNPPLWLVTDARDSEVDPGNSIRMAAAVRAKGGPAEARTYSGLDHALMVGTFASLLRFLAPVLRDSVDFLRAQTAEEGVS